MNDDWRLQVDFRNDGALDAMQDLLDAQELEHDLSEAFQDRVIVSRNDARLFLYAGDREQAERAQALVERLAQEDREEITIDFRRWHPIAEEWLPAEVPMPDSPAEERAERFAERLRAEGLPVVHRWKFVLAGAIDEEHARELAERIRSEAPPGSKVVAQGSWPGAYDRVNGPFAFLGGLAR